MAFRGSAKNLQSMVISQLGGGRRSFATSTIPKMKPVSPTIDASTSRFNHTPKAEFAPIYMVMGMVLVVVGLATHTAKQNLVHGPSVHFNKKKRETMPEVGNPDETIVSADKFINKSFLRKVAHIQEDKKTVSDPVHPNPFTRPRSSENLKTVGIEPSKH